MKTIKTLLIVLMTSYYVDAQVITIVEHEWEADLKVYFTSFEWNADAIVFPTKSIHHARNLDGHWYINNRQSGRNNESINIYVVGKSALADLSVFLTDDERKIKIEGAEQMLDESYGIKTAAGWCLAKFGVEPNLDQSEDLTIDETIDIIVEQAIKQYDEKEAVYPVMAGLYQFVIPASGGAQGRIDREGLVQWASRRFDTPLTLEDLKNKQRDEIHTFLLGKSRESQKLAQVKIEALHGQIESLSNQGGVPLNNANGEAAKLSDWFTETINHDLSLERVEALERDELQQALEAIVEDHFHPEFRRMERMVLLEIVDSAWKDHLLAMDYLRSAVGQRGMAQLDPKVEYKREGMRMFEGLWVSIGERVTDLVFRMEQMNEDFVSNTLVETSARHDDASAAGANQQQSEMSQEQSEAIDRSGGGQQAIETIRNRDDKVGRNDPCPCGSGKKYKSCCLRKRA